MTTAQLHTPGLHPKAMFSGMVHAPATLARRIARRHEFRRAFLPLLAERDQILSDIGYQRYDILRALRLPLSQDAMAYVESKRLTRPTEESPTRPGLNRS
jgi:uncharacterized protein YjiS (DUF1127 family)